jgi:hypothetical protein
MQTDGQTGGKKHGRNKNLIQFRAQNALYWRFTVTATNKTYLPVSIHVKLAIFLTDF